MNGRSLDSFARCAMMVPEGAIRTAPLDREGTAVVKFALHFGNFRSPTLKAARAVWCAWRGGRL